MRYACKLHFALPGRMLKRYSYLLLSMNIFKRKLNFHEIHEKYNIVFTTFLSSI